MTKNEFLEGLRKALGNDLDRETVQENVAYYDGYISVQVNIGRTEEEVTAELGDPWVIAQTIIDAEEAKRGTGRNAGSSYTTANSGFSDPVYGDGGDYTREDYYTCKDRRCLQEITVDDVLETITSVTNGISKNYR